MNITYDENLVRQNEDKYETQTVYFTLTDDNNVEYQWHCGNVPQVIDIQGYLEKNTERFLWLIRGREYPNIKPTEGMTIAEFDKYVKDNKIEPKPFESTHPKPSKEELEIADLKLRVEALEKKVKDKEISDVTTIHNT